MNKLIVGIIILLTVGLFLSPALIAYNTDNYIIAKVTDKQSITVSTGNGATNKYLIFTENEVFKNTDTIWYWKWNSSDFYREIKVGETYNFRVYGWRVPFISWYKNIISY